MYVPDTVVSHTVAAQSGYLSGLHRVTCLFIKVRIPRTGIVCLLPPHLLPLAQIGCASLVESASDDALQALQVRYVVPPLPRVCYSLSMADRGCRSCIKPSSASSCYPSEL